MSQYLRYSNLTVLSRKDCKRVWTYVEKDHLCTSTAAKKGVCYVSIFLSSFGSLVISFVNDK